MKVYAIDQADGAAFSTAPPTPAFGDAGQKGWTIQVLVTDECDAQKSAKMYILFIKPKATN